MRAVEVAREGIAEASTLARDSPQRVAAQAIDSSSSSGFAAIPGNGRVSSTGGEGRRGGAWWVMGEALAWPGRGDRGLYSDGSRAGQRRWCQSPSAVRRWSGHRAPGSPVSSRRFPHASHAEALSRASPIRERSISSRRRSVVLSGRCLAGSHDGVARSARTPCAMTFFCWRRLTGRGYHDRGAPMPHAAEAGRSSKERASSSSTVESTGLCMPRGPSASKNSRAASSVAAPVK